MREYTSYTKNSSSRGRKSAGLQNLIGNQAALTGVIQRYPCDELLKSLNEAIHTPNLLIDTNYRKIKAGLANLCAETAQLESYLTDSDMEVEGIAFHMVVKMLSTANELSVLAETFMDDRKDMDGFQTGNPLYEAMRSLYKFPHIILPANAKLSLELLPDILSNVIGKEKALKSEIGMFHLSDSRTKAQGMGLMLGREAKENAGVGALVSAPGKSSKGFEQADVTFLAHTHPIAFLSKAGDSELKTDQKTVGSERMEMVMRSDKETFLFYDEENIFNEKGTKVYEDQLKQRVDSKYIIIDCLHGAEDSEAYEKLDEALTSVYEGAKESCRRLRTEKLNSEEYKSCLETLHTQLLYSTINAEAKQYLIKQYPDNDIIAAYNQPIEEASDSDGMDWMDFLENASEKS